MEPDERVWKDGMDAFAREDFAAAEVRFATAVALAERTGHTAGIGFAARLLFLAQCISRRGAAGVPLALRHADRAAAIARLALYENCVEELLQHANWK